jgi:hypothetical protein
MNTITYTDDEEAQFGLISGPCWQDCCQHEAGSYVASFEICKPSPMVKGGYKQEFYDLYVFDQQGRQDVCIRYGAECSEYISPGHLGQFLTRFTVLEPYQTAARILLHFGMVQWRKAAAERLAKVFLDAVPLNPADCATQSAGI